MLILSLSLWLSETVDVSPVHILIWTTEWMDADTSIWNTEELTIIEDEANKYSKNKSSLLTDRMVVPSTKTRKFGREKCLSKL